MTPRSARTGLLLVALVLQFAGITPGYTQVVINEIMASNHGSVTNAGTYPDWIELLNIGAEPVDLSGYYILSIEDDDYSGQTNLFRFPGNWLPLQSGERLI